MAVTSLIAPATRSLASFFDASIAAEMMLSAPAREGRNARKNIACLALDMRSNSASRSGGASLPFFLALVFGEHQSWTSTAPFNLVVAGVASASRISGPWHCLAVPGEPAGRGAG